jgi:hypothetical protein
VAHLPKGFEKELKELEEFLAPLPDWLQLVVQEDLSSFPPDKVSLWMDYDWSELERLKQEYERIIAQIPQQWKAYRKRVRQNSELLRPMPKKNPGRPRMDGEAQRYTALHSKGKSYRSIAAEELQAEPDGEAKPLLIEKESERIRQLIRSRRRRKT